MEEISARGKPITDGNKVEDIVRKFKSKYSKVKKYYTKFDVAVEVLEIKIFIPRRRPADVPTV